MRKLISIGFESYVGNLYKNGKITLRAAAKMLKLSQTEAMDLFSEVGIRGNLSAADVLVSIERFGRSEARRATPLKGKG